MAKLEESNEDAQAKDVESHADAPHHGASELAPPAEQGGVQEPVKVEVILPPAQPETIAQHYGLPEDYVSQLEGVLGDDGVSRNLTEKLQKTFDAPYGVHADHEDVHKLLEYIFSTLGLEPLDSNEGDGISEEQEPPSEPEATQPSNDSSTETNEIGSPEETTSSLPVEEE